MNLGRLFSHAFPLRIRHHARLPVRLALVVLICPLVLGHSPAQVQAEVDAWSQRTFPQIEGGVVDALTAAPSNPAVLYALLQGANGGTRIFRSANAAVSWTELYNFEQWMGQVVVHPTDPDIVYAAGKGGLWRSTDAGHTWQHISPLGEGLVYPASGYLYAAGSLDGSSACPGSVLNIGFSVDGGDTWRFTPLECYVQSYQLVSSPAAPQVAYFVGMQQEPLMGLSIKTIDAGVTWFEMPLMVDDAFGSLLVDPANPAHLFASGSSGVIYSFDWGQSWTYPVDPGPKGTVTRLALSGGVLYAVPWSSWLPSSVFASQDGGVTWWKSVNTLPSGVLSLASSPAAVYAGTIGFGVYRVSGVEFLPVNTGLRLPAIPRMISAAPSGDLYALANIPHWSLFRSRDGGKTWSSTLLEQTGFSDWIIGTPGQTPQARPFQLAVEAAPTVPRRVVLAHPAQPGTAWVTGEHGLYELRGGAFDSAALAYYEVTDLSVSPLDPDHPIAAANRSGVGYVLKRECVEMMCMWEKTMLAAWPAFEIRSAAVDPNNPAHLLALGVDNSRGDAVMRVYGTTNGGASWQMVGELANNPGIYDIEFSPYDNRSVFGYAYGSLSSKSLYRSMDGGATWQAVGPDLAEYSSNTASPLAFDGLAQIYLGTGSGLYRRPVASGEWVKEAFANQPVQDLTAVYGSRPSLWALTNNALYQTSLPAARHYWMPSISH